MKSFYCCLLFLLSACTPTSFFKTPNDISKMNVTLYLLDQTQVKGILTIPFELNFNGNPPVPKTLKFIPEGKSVEEDIELKDIIGYSIDQNYYALKHVFLLSTNSTHLLFVKRLTSGDSRISLYELYESGKGNSTNESRYSWFISLPTSSQFETINIQTSKLVPDFDQKMNLFVSDCPSLAQKISTKEKGYFMPLFSFDKYKHRDVMLKIITEYNNCK